MAKIAVELERALTRRQEAGTEGELLTRTIAGGEGWTVADLLCTSGPADRPYEERHARYAIAVVLAGSFQYRSTLARGLLTPGSLILGRRSQCFECGHRHGEGDRCVAFWYEAEYFERLAADAGVRDLGALVKAPSLPAMASLSPLVARAKAGVLGVPDVPWDELAADLAVRTVQLAAGVSSAAASAPPNAEARVSRMVRTIDRHPDARWTLGQMARHAGFSPYHFLRTFERITGLTPHQYVRRVRLREAATRLITEPGKVIDVALESGFADVSTFNRAFRAEFGVSPRAFRRGAAA